MEESNGENNIKRGGQKYFTTHHEKGSGDQNRRAQKEETLACICGRYGYHVSCPRSSWVFNLI
jgi:hypothetical protein